MKLFLGIFFGFLLSDFLEDTVIQCYCQAFPLISALFQLSATSEHPGTETVGAPKLKSSVNSKGTAF